MSFARRLAKFRYALILPFALASLASLPSIAQAQGFNQPPPPPMRAEMVPGGRPGFAWDPGHWRWEGGGYGWVPGHWEAMRGHGHWQPGHWVARGPNWFWVDGRWVR